MTLASWFWSLVTDGTLDEDALWTLVLLLPEVRGCWKSESSPSLLARKHSESQRRAGTHLRSQELGTEQGLKSKCSDLRAGPSHCVWLTMGQGISSWALQRRLASLQGVIRRGG